MFLKPLMGLRQVHGKLPPAAKLMPPIPKTPVRKLYVRGLPTQFIKSKHVAQVGEGVSTIVPGHVDAAFVAQDLEELNTGLGSWLIAIGKQGSQIDLPEGMASVLKSLLQSGRDAGNVKGGAAVTLGQQPDPSGFVHRAWKCRSVTDPDTQFWNTETDAKKLTDPHSGTDSSAATMVDLGTFTPALWLVLLHALWERGDKHYALAGKTQTVPYHLWTAQEWMDFLRGVGVHGGENCVGFLEWFFDTIASYMAPGGEMLPHLKRALSQCRHVEDVMAVAQAFFRKNEKGHISLIPSPPKLLTLPSQEKKQELNRDEVNALRESMGMETLEEEEEREAKEKAQALVERRQKSEARATKLPLYADYAKAFGDDPDKQFVRFAAALVEDESIFELIFTDPQYKPAGERMFEVLGKRLRALPAKQGKGVAFVMLHQNTYPGDITHISTTGFSRDDGRVSISHQESIPKKEGKTEMIDGLAVDIIGCASASYNTLTITNAVRKKHGLAPIEWKDLPIVRSLLETGTPMMLAVDLDDFDGFEQFNLRSAQESASAQGLDTHYGTNPSMTLQALAEGVKSGKIQLTEQQAKLLMTERRFALHPMLPPPGHDGDFSWGDSTNNCARQTYLALEAGKAPKVAAFKYRPGMTLAQVTRLFIDAGVLPNTDPDTADLMDKGGYTWDSKSQTVMAHPYSFLCLAYSWSLAPDGMAGVVEPDVPRLKLKNHDELQKRLLGYQQKLQALAQKNWDAFKANYQPSKAKDVIVTPPPGPMVALGPADWPAVAAHVKRLTEDERKRRFPYGDPDQVIESLKRGRSRLYGVRDPKTHEILVMLEVKLYLRGDDFVAEGAISTVPEARKKGWGLWAFKWSCAWARNRGAVLRVGQFRADNVAAAKIIDDLAKVGPVEIVKDDGSYRYFQIPLAQADRDSWLMEHFSLGPAEPQPPLAGMPPKK
ncbi:hypothetical protein [Caldimonas sp. KR1-144]|uniref:hypothetical protein n=1 Tax=Caldimonas sp. KR1-144 TaxID=3400911 RepID=UPI003C0D1795